jgi:hypothetical protein
MLDTPRHDDKLAWPQLDNPVPELDAKLPSPDKKHLFYVTVVMPWERPLHLDQLDLLAVQLDHDLGLPLLREAGKLFGDIDAFHTHPHAQIRSITPHYSLRAAPASGLGPD